MGFAQARPNNTIFGYWYIVPFVQLVVPHSAVATDLTQLWVDIRRKSVCVNAFRRFDVTTSSRLHVHNHLQVLCVLQYVHTCSSVPDHSYYMVWMHLLKQLTSLHGSTLKNKVQ